MSKKRSRSPSSSSGPPARTKISNEYEGYLFTDPNPKLDIVDKSISAKDFYDLYISKRRPCIITNILDTMKITAETLEEVAGGELLQVEKRPSCQQHFGQNRTAELQKMLPLSEFLSLMKDESQKELHYLSTQQKSDSPCKELREAGYLPVTLDLAGQLKLETCNLWMGGSTESSSGLHHDFHDNFYMLFNGRKEFRLYAPSEARHVQLHGQVEMIHSNGLISYCRNPTGPDGYPLVETEGEGKDDDDEEEVVLGKGFDYKSDDDSKSGLVDFEDGKDDYDDIFGNSKEITGSQDDEDEEPEVVLGKGADYKSGSEDEQADFDNGVDDYAVLFGDENTEMDDQQNRTHISRPDHFSKVSPSDLTSCRECVVSLAAGQVLYLPASWFHHVSSFRDKAPFHLAVNYWYHPPDQLENFYAPYSHPEHWA